MFSRYQLQLLDSVARLGSFSAAAQQLHKVPSAISYSVRQIEAELGVVLFTRLTRRVELTEAGQHFLKECRLMLRQMDEVREQTQRVANGWSDKLRVVVDNVVQPSALVSLLEDFYAEFDDAELETQMEVYNGVWDAIADDRADLAIGATSVIPIGGDFDFRSMGALKWSFVVAPEHPCAQFDELTLEQIQPYPYVCLRDSARVLPKYNTWVQDSQRRMMVPDWNRALACLERGVAVGMAPEHMIKDRVAAGRLVERVLHPRRPDSECCLAWRKNAMSPQLEWLLQRLGDSERLHREWLA